ncbi:synaptic vesicle glycoprotein 2B-like [Leptopilina heterotoma]|uniref:synaptic vesicle glycoprotein 2B-like n=1 Tax=Leptopilina heterotoma TaxID=63436 RepID=UPI001CAA14CB|nr:synaptic vesicle glycoprotein 2B-like [Leptopilina heterotoma]
MERRIPEIFHQLDIKLSEKPGINQEIIVHDDTEGSERGISILVVEEAVENIGFGKFNLKITLIGILIHTNVMLNLLNLGYILSSTVCDFKMTTTKKGILAVAPTVGTCLGALCWGFITNSKGSKLSLIFVLFLHGGTEICLSLFVYNYWFFLFFKIISGFAAMGAINSIYTYVGHFQPSSHEKIIFACLSFVYAIALMILPLLAWAIIPLRFEFRMGNFFFGSWKLFVLVTAVPLNFFAILLIFMPETPQYFAKIGHYKELLNVLTRMYQENHGGSSEDYIKFLLHSGNAAMVDLVNRCQYYSTFTGMSKKDEDLNYMLNCVKGQGENVLKAPYLRRLIILSIAMFCVSSATYSLTTWFPEIIHRFSQYEKLNKNGTVDDCNSISKSRHTFFDENGIFHAASCNQTIDTSVYRTSFLMGLSVVFPNLLYLYFVDKFGFRFIVGVYFCVGLLGTLSLFFINSFTQSIILACIFKAVMCTTLSILFQFNAELFPDDIRLFTGSIASFCSRLGIIFGNGLFAHLIDEYCTGLIVVAALQLSLAIILCVTLRA